MSEITIKIRLDDKGGVAVHADGDLAQNTDAAWVARMLLGCASQLFAGGRWVRVPQARSHWTYQNNNFHDHHESRPTQTQTRGST